MKRCAQQHLIQNNQTHVHFLPIQTSFLDPQTKPQCLGTRERKRQKGREGAREREIERFESQTETQKGRETEKRT